MINVKFWTVNSTPRTSKASSIVLNFTFITTLKVDFSVQIEAITISLME
ncbi:hypothetical protein [Haloimpatiens massiliensis]|nr:hypothetical protein [Haloimpatiens massiliensis]